MLGVLLTCLASAFRASPVAISVRVWVSVDPEDVSTSPSPSPWLCDSVVVVVVRGVGASFAGASEREDDV